MTRAVLAVLLAAAVHRLRAAGRALRVARVNADARGEVIEAMTAAIACCPECAAAVRRELARMRAERFNCNAPGGDA